MPIYSFVESQQNMFKKCLIRNFQIIKHFRYFIYSPVFKSAQLASEQVPFKQT